MRLTKLTVVVSLFALVLVGCGGGDSDDGGGGGGTTGGGATTGDDGGTVIDGGALDAATCAQVVAAMASAYSGSAAAMTGGSPDLQASVDQLEAFAASAPEEIRDDMQTIAAAYATMMQAFADSGYDPASGQAPTPEQVAALQQATAAINTAEFQQASDNVSAWFEEQCPGA
jgi:hypothetical protein